MKVLCCIGAVMMVLYCCYFTWKNVQKYSMSYNTVDIVEVITDTLKTVGIMALSVISVLLAFSNFQ